jgi:hypothetical protein
MPPAPPAPPICLRCLGRSLAAPSAHPSTTAAATASFSATSSLSANPPKRRPVAAYPTAKATRSLKLAKNTRVTTSRPPAEGERKALRKRVVLSNTNALEVTGVEDLGKENAVPEKLAQYEGRVLGFEGDAVDRLRALEGFKPRQGWNLFRRPATLVRRETVQLAELLQRAEANKDAAVDFRRVLFGERGSGKSVLLLQAMAMAQLRGWLVLHVPGKHVRAFTAPGIPKTTLVGYGRAVVDGNTDSHLQNAKTSPTHIRLTSPTALKTARRSISSLISPPSSSATSPKPMLPCWINSVSARSTSFPFPSSRTSV